MEVVNSICNMKSRQGLSHSKRMTAETACNKLPQKAKIIFWLAGPKIAEAYGCVSRVVNISLHDSPELRLLSGLDAAMQDIESFQYLSMGVEPSIHVLQSLLVRVLKENTAAGLAIQSARYSNQLNKVL